MTFAIVPAPLFADTRLNRADLRVFGALASFANTERTCWPSRKAIAERCGIRSLALISDALSRLVRYGWIEIKHRLGSSLYRLLDPLHPVVDDALHPVVDDLKQTNPTDQLTPFPRESQIDLDQDPEPALEQPVQPDSAPIDTDATPQPETPVQADSEAINEQDVVQALIAHFFLTSGVDCDRPRHRKAIVRALKANSADEITRAASHCASTWSNRAWATPAAVLKPGRVDEVLSQAKATAAPRQAAHKLFEREQPIPRAKLETAKAGLSALKAALAGKATSNSALGT